MRGECTYNTNIMDEKKKIVVIGSSNTDMVIHSKRLPKPGETVLGGTFLTNFGGKGANQAMAVAKLGGDVSFICKVGNDTFGKEAITSFSKENIDTRYIQVSLDRPSGVALINVDSNGENYISVAPGANGDLSTEDIKNAEEVIDKASIVLMQLETPLETIIYAAKLAKAKGALIVLNPAPASSYKLSDDLLSNIDILIPNETEASIISGIHIIDENSAKDAVKAISRKGIKTIIVTLGAKGALAYENEEFIFIPANKVKAVDTTAAGDTFCGGLCVALSEGKSLQESVRFASRASSICVTRIGAQQSIPYRKELK